MGLPNTSQGELFTLIDSQNRSYSSVGYNDYLGLVAQLVSANRS